MTNLNPTARLVLTTVATADEAGRLGRTLVEERLAACATLVPAVQSTYWWQGTIEHSTETLLVLKTEAGRLTELEARMHQLHGYDTPEFLVLPVDSGSSRYLDWLHACLERP